MASASAEQLTGEHIHLVTSAQVDDLLTSGSEELKVSKLCTSSIWPVTVSAAMVWTHHDITLYVTFTVPAVEGCKVFVPEA